MNLILLKINSGEHIIAEVLDENSHEYKLKNHCMVFPAPDGSNAIKVLPTYNIFDNGEVTFPKSQVVYYGQPYSEIRDQYESAFGSVILTQSSAIMKAQ